MEFPDHVAEATAFEAIRILNERPSLSQRELASALGVSLGKANYCLRGLIAKGLVKARNYRNSKNKAAYLYLLTPKGVAEKARLTREYLALRTAEFDRLAAEIARLEQEVRASQD